MKPHELIRLSAREIRTSEQKMHLFKQYFRDAFSFTPACTPCTFKSDFKRLREHYEAEALKDKKKTTNIQKAFTMGTFKLKRKFMHKILTYRMDGRDFRVYGKMASDDFLANFLTFGTEAQIENRKKMFDVIPEGWKPEMRPWANSDVPQTKEDRKRITKSVNDGTLNLQQLRELTVKQIRKYAKDQGIELPKKARKNELIEEVLTAQL